MQSRAAIRYAKAIYEIADEENFIKEIFNDMIRINKLNRDSSDFKNLLSNSIIDNFDKLNLEENNYLFHAGTKIKDNKIFAVGGRVLNFISLSNTYSEAKKNIYENLKKLNWEKGFFRKDIGYKVINK